MADENTPTVQRPDDAVVAAAVVEHFAKERKQAAGRLVQIASQIQHHDYTDGECRPMLENEQELREVLDALRRAVRAEADNVAVHEGRAVYV